MSDRMSKKEWVEALFENSDKDSRMTVEEAAAELTAIICYMTAMCDMTGMPYDLLPPEDLSAEEFADLWNAMCAQ